MKLLHEKLRDYSKQCLSINRIMEIEKVIHLGELLNKWADETEHQYLKRLRYEDGEPADFGDEFVDHNGNVQQIGSMAYTKGKTDYVRLNGWSRVELDKPLRRPDPKVLDADGVEIKVGDTLFAKNGESNVVASIHMENERPLAYKPTAGKPFVRYVCNRWNFADEVTHREPDSLEKLRDDIASYVSLTDNESKPAQWRDRLTEIMERDA